MTETLLTIAEKPISGPHPDGSDYTESLLNDRSAPDGHYLYGVTPE